MDRDSIYYAYEILCVYLSYLYDILCVCYEYSKPMKDILLHLETLMAPYLYGFCRLVFGTLYPAYASYKAVRTKNVKEYVKWMMYWIVFALFLCVETFSDVFISWLPFYYEVKIVFVLWLLSPITKGSSFLFKKFVHPQLAKREKDIDEMIIQASKQGYSTLVKLSSRGISYATNVFMKTALTGHGKLVDHLRRSYSTSDLSDDGNGLSRSREMLDDYDEEEDELDNRLYEDNKEIEARKDRRVVKSSESKKTEKVKMKKSTSANAGLTSVMEVDEDDEEMVVTEEITYIPVTRKHYTHKEQPQDNKNKQKQISKYGTLPKSYGRTTRSTRKTVHKEF